MNDARPGYGAQTRGADARPSSDHYSYAVYADPAMAERFDAMRFGGPIGQLIAETQEQQIAAFLAPVEGRRVLDVGTGTGRAAIALAKRGAIVTGVDASAEMLRGRAAPAKQPSDASPATAASTFARGDAHRLDFPDRSFDAVVCLRVLMHTPDWRASLGELCRVADDRVVFDYPSLYSAAAHPGGHAPRRRTLSTPSVEAYRVFSPAARRARACATPGFRVAGEHRQFVLPIALHKRMNSEAWTRRVEGAMDAHRADAAVRLAGDDRGRTVRVLVTGATGFTGGHLARALKARGDDVSGAGARRPSARRRSGRRRHPHRAPAISPIPRRLPAAVAGGFDVVYNIAALYRQAGLPDSVYHQVNATAVGQLIEAAAAAGVRRVVHCSTVGVHGDVEHPPANEDAPLRPGDVYQVTKLEGERLAREAAARTGVEVVIARPSGIYGPGDRRLLKLFRGVARRRFVILGDGRIFYHLTYIDDLVEGFRLCGEVPRGRGAHLHPRRRGSADAERADRADRARTPACAPPSLHLPVWPFWLAGAACEALCAPFGIEPPLYRRRVDFFTKSRAFDITRAREELGYAPRTTLRDGIRRTLTWYRQQGWI